MAKLPPLKRILEQDLESLPTWFRPALIVLNSFCQNVWQALNRGLSLQDNLKSQIVELNYVGGAVMAITTSIKEPLVAVLVLQTAGAPITGGVTVEWNQIGPAVNITQITGLTAGEEYKLRLLLL